MNSNKNKLNTKISWQKLFLPNIHLVCVSISIWMMRKQKERGGT